MTLQTIMDGSLPNDDVDIFVPEPKPHPNAGPRKHWTVARIAAKIGVGVTMVHRALRESPEVRAHLRAGPDGHLSRFTDNGITAADVVAAAETVLRLAKRWHPWAPKLELDACVVCNSDEFDHRYGGMCRRCESIDYRRRHGLGVAAFHGAWDRTRGLVACVICARSSVPHKLRGMCNACTTWDFHARKELTAPAYVKAVARRRKFIARGLSGKGKPSAKRRRRARASR